MFTTSDAIERLWEISEPVLEGPPPVRPYTPGSWGPEDAEGLIRPRRWHLPGHPIEPGAHDANPADGSDSGTGGDTELSESQLS